MGKRKKSTRKPQGPKKREPLATSFRCLFCNHETAVSVKIDRKSGIASLGCKSCGQTFQTGTNYLTTPTDVYSEWIDACDAVAKDEAISSAPPPTVRQRQAPALAHTGLAPREKYTQEDGFIDDADDEDAEVDYVDD